MVEEKRRSGKSSVTITHHLAAWLLGDSIAFELATGNVGVLITTPWRC